LLDQIRLPSPEIEKLINSIEQSIKKEV